MTAKYIVRHGVMRFLGEFEAKPDVAPERGTRVVVRSERGHEVGDVLCEATPRAVEMLSEPTRGTILRPLNADDLAALERVREQERRAFDACRRCVEQRKM